MTNIIKLIVVPGHAPLRDSVEELPGDFREDKYWVLQEFQKGEPPYYVEHIQAGVRLAEQDSAALLIFSGGRTRRESEKWSEAATYKAIADELEPAILGKNIELEEFARDSFENLEFSLYQFYRKTGRYPIHVTVAGWKFKEARFRLHASTLGIPADKFKYIGVNNPEDLEGAMKGEDKVVADFQADPFGRHGMLQSKRMERNPFNDSHPYGILPPISIG